MLTLTSLELKSFFNIDESQVSRIASVYLLGCVLGALIFGYLASKFGRKRLFSITLIIYFFSVICISFIENYYLFMVCRFFTGIHK